MDRKFKEVAKQAAILLNVAKDVKSKGELLGLMVGLRYLADQLQFADAKMDVARQEMGLTPENWEVLLIQFRKDLEDALK